MRKTAHISMLVEFDDELTPPDVVVSYNLNGLRLHGDAVVIGTPAVTVHKRAITSLSHNEYMEAITAMEARGGGFARALGEALLKADSTHSAQLCCAFWNLICAYRSEAVPA